MPYNLDNVHRGRGMNNINTTEITKYVRKLQAHQIVNGMELSRTYQDQTIAKNLRKILVEEVMKNIDFKTEQHINGDVHYIATIYVGTRPEDIKDIEYTSELSIPLSTPKRINNRLIIVTK